MNLSKVAAKLKVQEAALVGFTNTQNKIYLTTGVWAGGVSMESFSADIINDRSILEKRDPQEVTYFTDTVGSRVHS